MASIDVRINEFAQETPEREYYVVELEVMHSTDIPQELFVFSTSNEDAFSHVATVSDLHRFPAEVTPGTDPGFVRKTFVRKEFSQKVTASDFSAYSQQRLSRVVQLWQGDQSVVFPGERIITIDGGAAT